MNQEQVYSYEYNESEVGKYMSYVYLWMTLGVLITAVVAMISVKSIFLMKLMYTNRFTILGMFLVQVLFVGFLSRRVLKMSVQGALLGFFAYAALNGVIFSFIFLIYTSQSIANIFFITAGLFAALSALGYFTKKDLSGIGKFLYMAVIGLIIASVVNFFFANSMLYWMISYAGVLIFSALTVYDTQKIKNIYLQMSPQGEASTKLSILGALSLYLDFINLFLFLLRIFGRRK